MGRTPSFSLSATNLGRRKCLHVSSRSIHFRRFTTFSLQCTRASPTALPHAGRMLDPTLLDPGSRSEVRSLEYLLLGGEKESFYLKTPSTKIKRNQGTIEVGGVMIARLVRARSCPSRTIVLLHLGLYVRTSNQPPHRKYPSHTNTRQSC